MSKTSLIIIISLLTIVSCRKSDSRLTDDFIIGKWFFYYANLKKDGIIIKDSIDHDYNQYEFKPDGTIVFEDENGKSGLWKIEGDTLLMGTDKRLMAYNTLISSSKKIILEVNFDDKTYSFYFKKE